MPINFDALPNSKPNALPEKGTYYATIEKAEMKQPKDPNKPKYINLMYALKTKEGKSVGKIFDGIYESDTDLMRYKLKRFIEALDIKLRQFELKDLCKIIVGKNFIVDIMREEKEGQAPKAEVGLF
jgi:5-formaminoimidazole-4-carboxamide-1-beta-D-ribofuranosyl 5'-monophosphate synthetase